MKTQCLALISGLTASVLFSHSKLGARVEIVRILEIQSFGFRVSVMSSPDTSIIFCQLFYGTPCVCPTLNHLPHPTDQCHSTVKRGVSARFIFTRGKLVLRNPCVLELKLGPAAVSPRWSELDSRSGWFLV